MSERRTVTARGVDFEAETRLVPGYSLDGTSEPRCVVVRYRRSFARLWREFVLLGVGREPTRVELTTAVAFDAFTAYVDRSE